MDGDAPLVVVVRDVLRVRLGDPATGKELLSRPGHQQAITSLRYSGDGKLLFSWGEPGTDPGQFNIPHNIVSDPDGWVYVADRENHRVQIFDGQGRYQGQWNNLHRPCGLFIARQNGEARGGALVLLYLLVKSVFQKRDASLLPPEEAYWTDQPPTFTAVAPAL